MTGELLTEGEALKLYRGWNQLQPHQLPRAKERLRAYVNARKAEEEPLWPQYEANRNRAAIEQTEGLWLTDTPDPAPEARDVRQFHFMSGLTNRQPYDIAVEPQRYRRIVADYLGTASAGESPETFDALVRQHVQHQRDLRLLRFGTGKDDEASKPINEASLAAWAADTARDGKSAAEGFAAWQEQAKSAPGYEKAQADGEGLFTEFQQRHSEAAQHWRGLESRADLIIAELAKEAENDSPFVLGDKALPNLEGLTRPERQAVLSLVYQRATTKDKGFLKQSGEALGRVFSRLIESQADTGVRDALGAIIFKEGMEALAEEADKPALLVERRASRVIANIGAGMMGDASGMAGAGVDTLFADKVRLTKTQADAANAEVSRQRESLAILKDLRDAARGAVDPVKGGNVMTKWVWYPFLNIGGSVASFAMSGGWATNLNAYISDEQNRLESIGVDAGTAAGQAVFVGSLQAAADRFQLSLLSKSAAAKSLAGLLKAPSKSALGAFARRIPGALGVAAVEAGTEGVQQATPLLVQKALDALGVDEPDVSWSEIGKEAWAATVETFFGMLPLVMIGAGIGGHRDYKAVREIVGDTQALRMLGFSEAQTENITKAGDEEAMVAALRREWPSRKPVVTAAATPAEQRADTILADPTEDVSRKAAAATFKADADAARARQAELMAESGVSAVVRNDDGWHVVRDDGSRVAVSSPQAATALMQDLKRAGSQAEADAMIAVADELAARDTAAGRKSSQTFSGDAVKATPEGVTATSPKGKAREIEFSPAALQTLAEELALLGVDSAAIQGANWIAEDGTRMYQTNQTAEGVLTQVHEFAEARFRDLAAEDGGAAAIAAAQAVAPLFDPAKARTPAEKAFAQRVQNIAAAKTNETEARETLVELAVADTLGRFKDGRRIAAGSIEASLRVAMEAQGGPINGVLAFFRAVKNYLRGLFGVASALHKGRRSGAIKEGDEFSTFVDKLLGVDSQKEHEAGVLKEAGIEGLREAEKVSYSIGVAARLAAKTKAAGTLAEEDFFGRFWPDMLKAAGQNLRAARKNIGEAAKRAVEDIEDWLRGNPRYLEYYSSDWKSTRAILDAAFPGFTDDEFVAFRLFTGVTSPGTPLDGNMTDAVQVMNLWRQSGSIQALALTVSERGQRTAGPAPFALRGATGANKIFTLHVLEKLHGELGTWGGVLTHLQEGVTMKELHGFNSEVGYEGLIRSPGDIRRVVSAATGQDEIVPRAFVFGPKVGAYTLNVTGDHRFTTIDVWESRFIRSYFPGMFKQATGIVADGREHQIFHEFSTEFHRQIEEKMGVKIEPSALQAVRWFYMIAMAKKAGYRRALSTGTISDYTEKAVRRHLPAGLDHGGGRRGDEDRGQEGQGDGEESQALDTAEESDPDAGRMTFSVSTRLVDPSSYAPSAQRVIGLTNVATLTRARLKEGEALVPLTDKPGEKLMVSPAYRRAKKEGDRHAAWDIAGDFVRQDRLTELRAALKDRRPVFVPVHQVEGREFNLLPIAAAWRLQRALGGRVDHSVRKKAQGDGNTGASAQERMTKDSTFTGPVATAGADEAIVLVDDTFTSGSTLVALYDYFHEGGAQPAAFFTLATGRYSKNLSATPEQQARAIDKAGISRDEFTNVFGIPISRFTGAELQSYALNGQGGIAGFRRRFGLPGGQSGRPGRASRMVPPAGGEQRELSFSIGPLREGDGPTESDGTDSFRQRAREERENLIALKREVEAGGDDEVRFEMEATLRRLRTFAEMPGYPAVDASSSIEEWAADALLADPKLSAAQAMAAGVERRARQVAAVPEKEDGLSNEERLLINEQVASDLPYFRRLLETAAKQIEGGSFVNLPFDAQQSVVEGLQRDVQLPVTLERNRAGTVVRIRSKVPRREPAGEKGGPSAAAPALPADAAPAADPHIIDGEGRRVKVPVWLAERLYDDGFPEAGPDTKENILYAVAGSDGNVGYTWHSGQTAHDFMRTMAIRGEWLWKLNIVTGKAELIGGVPLRHPVERAPAEPYENETPRMAGNVPHRDPYGRIPRLPKTAIRYGTRSTGEGANRLVEGHEFVLKRMPLPDKSFAAGDVAFSLGSVNSLEAIAARFEAMAGPETKLEIYRDTARTLEGMARAARNNEETERVLAIGEIEKERRELQRKLEDEYVEAVWRGPAGGILSAEDMATLRAQPLMDAILRPLEKGEKGALAGRLLSRARARKEGRNLEGEFDGSEELPFWLFRGERAPDQMAQELYEEGLIEDTYPDTMWQAIHSALSSAAKNREWLKKAREQIAEARDRARTEAREWAAAERVKLATSDKRDARRALVTLDAMLMHLPAEVRAKVGGFAVLGDLKTNQAREAHFLRMVEKIDRELESYLRKEYVLGIREVIEKGKARKRPGEKDRGKLGVNTHTWLEAADAIMTMSPVRLAERESYVAAKLGGEELTVEEITELNRQWDFGEDEDAARLALEQESALLDLFGGITHTANGRYLRSSGELEAAWIAARDAVKRGRDAWNDTLNERRARRAGRRAGLQLNAGLGGVNADGILRAVEERKESMKGWAGAVVRYFRKGFSFEQFIGDVFGRGSDTHRWAEDTVREAELTEAALFQQSQNDTADLLRSVWPRTKTAGRLRHLEALSTPREVPGAEKGAPKLSELQAVHLTMLWADEDSRPWLRKFHLGDGEPAEPDGEKGVDTQAALEAFLSPQARMIRAWLQERYDAQYDVLNGVYRRLHGVNMPRVKNYSPRMVEHGKDAAVIDPLGPGGLSARGVFAGFTKRRQPDLTAAPVAADALQAFVQNQRVVTHFVAWAEASLDLRAVFSSSESAPFIKAAAGEQGQADLLQWLTDLEAGGMREAQASAIWRRWLRANSDNALVGKLGVLAKQIPAMYGAAAEIGWGDYLASARRVATGTAARPVKEAVESRIMRARGFQRPPEIGQAASGTGASPLTGKLRRYGVDLNRVDLTMEYLRGRIGATDAWFTARGAAIAYDAHFRDGKAQKMSDPEAHAYAERLTERTVSRTAQPDLLANKSLAENHAGTFGRLLHQFQSANRQALFMTIAAFRDGGFKSGSAWRMAVTHWALTGIVTQTVGSLIRDLMSDDDDDIWSLGDYMRAILLGPLTGAVHIGPIIDAVASLFGGFERRQAAGIAAAATDIGKEFVEMLKEGDEIEWRDQEKAVRGLGLLLGGRWSALNVSENVGKQLIGFADNLTTTEAEATERKAKAQRKKPK